MHSQKKKITLSNIREAPLETQVPVASRASTETTGGAFKTVSGSSNI